MKRILSWAGDKIQLLIFSASILTVILLFTINVKHGWEILILLILINKIIQRIVTNE